MAISLYAVINVACIVFFGANEYRIVSNVMKVFCFTMGVLSFLYFRHKGRWNRIYEELHCLSISQKYRYGFYCLLNILLSYGLWFLSNDVIRVLNTGEGMSFAIKIVDLLGLAYW